MPMFRLYDAGGVALIWRQADGAASSATGSLRPERRFDVLADGVFVWGRRRPTAGGTTLDLVQSGAVALSGSVSVSGDIQIGTVFDLAQSGAVALSGAAAVSGDIQPSLEPVREVSTGAGRAAVRRRRPVVVEIDGQDFIVESEQEAIALLDKAKEEAEQLAQTQIARATKAEKRKPGKVVADARKALVAPSIRAPGFEDYAQQILTDIRESYASAMRTIEVAALLRKRERDEEDDEDVLMLML